MMATMELEKNTTSDIPIELECWLLKHGFFEKDKGPSLHAEVAWPDKPDDKMESKGWKPSFEGEEPPF